MKKQEKIWIEQEDQKKDGEEDAAGKGRVRENREKRENLVEKR